MKAEEPDLLADLDDDQLQAVTHDQGPLLILAGAGSGKTRAITRRIAWLIRDRGVPPSRILAATFTNKAAGEMRERVERMVGAGDAPSWMGTFHSLGLRMLRRYADRLGYPPGFVVFDEDDSEKVIREVCKSLGIPKERVGALGTRIDRAKNDGILEFRADERNPADREFAQVFAAYQRELKANGAMDYGDLLALWFRLLEDHVDVRQEIRQRFLHVLVDEFQDTNAVQYEILKHLAAVHRNLCVVGDDDQSIYSWRGAQVDNILDFPKDYPDARVVTLGRNYRSRGSILQVAARVIAFNRSRHPKALRSVRAEEGRPVEVYRGLDEVAEARFVASEIRRRIEEGVALSRVAVFYRTNAQSRVLEDALRQRGIPYRVVGGLKFYQRKEVKDVLGYLRLLVNPLDRVALERVIHVPSRGIGPTTVQKARELADQEGEDLLVALAMIADQSGDAMRRRVQGFLETITDLAAMAIDRPAPEVVRAVLDRTGYLAMLREDTSLEGQNRLENVMELVASVDQFMAATGESSLKAWLDRVSLVQPLDEGGEGEVVSLMTVHAAKGLEFDCVFVCGLEEGLFPIVRSDRSRDRPSPSSREALEEERRLFYVAMTRARDRLTLCCASMRTRYGRREVSIPSRFLGELPRELVRMAAAR
ncbi:MAG TPA: UvrD-helicase domain-containing protein [Myxococcota bacterium]|nr:UvrD-helicase domain-containing protein [Myxococcota bacterium]HQK50320.1 UvrD-helicase domain-containing protein [Myxococcota bacterium]